MDFTFIQPILAAAWVGLLQALGIRNGKAECFLLLSQTVDYAMRHKYYWTFRRLPIKFSDPVDKVESKFMQHIPQQMSRKGRRESLNFIVSVFTTVFFSFVISSWLLFWSQSVKIFGRRERKDSMKIYDIIIHVASHNSMFPYLFCLRVRETRACEERDYVIPSLPASQFADFSNLGKNYAQLDLHFSHGLE